MKRNQLTQRLAALKNWSDACELASNLYGTADKCEGNLAERFIAGWTNAADMADEKTLDLNDWTETRYITLAAVLNVEPDILAPAVGKAVTPKLADKIIAAGQPVTLHAPRWRQTFSAQIVRRDRWSLYGSSGEVFSRDEVRLVA